VNYIDFRMHGATIKKNHVPPVPTTFILFLAVPFSSMLCVMTYQLLPFTDGKECSVAF